MLTSGFCLGVFYFVSQFQISATDGTFRLSQAVWQHLICSLLVSRTPSAACVGITTSVDLSDDTGNKNGLVWFAETFVSMWTCSVWTQDLAFH